ncbi:hypothetical protein KR044_006515 [Drosophila immigrans]|nr:hypothetical protein KR044_006515 [Drosophila immigrans]
MTSNFGFKDGILIRIMTLEDLKRIEESIYDDEPLQSALENESEMKPPKSIIVSLEETHISMVSQGTSLVAIDEEDSGRIVGSVLAGCETFGDLQMYYEKIVALDDCAFKTVTIFELETKIKVNYFDRYGVSKVLYSQMTNVDASMRGKGLGTRLAAALMELGRSKGLPIMTAWCTSFYSARQKEAMGMECIYSQKYADYKDSNRQVVFKPPAPHTQLRVLAIKL